MAATVQLNPDGKMLACFPVVASDECQPNGGIVLSHLDSRALSAKIHYPDGVMQTGPLWLAGMWSSSSDTLTLDSSPRAAGTVTPFLTGSASGPDPGGDVRRNYDRLWADHDTLKSQGIWVVDGAPTPKGLVVMVVAANSQVVSYLQQQYSASQVVSWMQPA